MAYTPIGWINDQAPAINQTNLNKMDEEIERQSLCEFEGSAYLPSCDLNTITKVNRFYLLVDSQTYQNVPDNLNAGFLFVYTGGTFTLQVFYNFNLNKFWMRKQSGNTFTASWDVVYNKNEINNAISSLNTTVSKNAKDTGRALSEIYLDAFFGEYIYPSNYISRDITYNWDDTKKVIHVKRAAQSSQFSFCNITNQVNVNVGETYYVGYTHTTNLLYVEVYGIKSDNSVVRIITIQTQSGEFTIPSDVVKMYSRLYAPAGAAFEDDVIVSISNKKTYDNIIDELNNKCFQGSPTTLPSCDLNDVLKVNRFYILGSENTYQNIPQGLAGFLMVYTSNNWTMQVFVHINTANIYIRRANASGVWNTWTEIGSGGGGGVVNNYTFNEYSNSYSVTATPTITSDTNNYLASTGDTTDRTNDIITMLTQSGVCRLGPGDFYVNGVDMPDSSFLVGSGRKTRLILSGSGDGYCVKMGNYCQISDLAMYGSLNSITLSSTVGGRHGLLWQGNYTQTQSSASQPAMGIVNNVRFFNFTGGGITCYDTGYGTFNALEVCNAYMYGCNAGINISYWSEFHKFTNVRTPSCYYGCINNGGNNTFVNCDFSTCKLGFLMDNSQSQSPNNSHGSVVGCVFNHTDSNAGIGIKILNCNNGYIFTGCQIFFSQIDIEDSSGIVISDTNFGLTNTNITIVNGGAVLFANNIHQGAPTISITNNQFVHFANCYTRAGEVVSA